jgi:hypothetical protein
MQSRPQQVVLNLEHARDLLVSGTPCRKTGRTLRLTSNQLGHIRRTRQRETLHAPGCAQRSRTPPIAICRSVSQLCHRVFVASAISAMSVRPSQSAAISPW